MYVRSSTADSAATGTTSLTVGERARGNASGQPRTNTVRHDEAGQVVWRVRCGDLISRHRCVTVFVENGEVVLVGPPGETARLTRRQLGELKAALDEAAELVER